MGRRISGVLTAQSLGKAVESSNWGLCHCAEWFRTITVGFVISTHGLEGSALSLALVGEGGDCACRSFLNLV